MADEHGDQTGGPFNWNNLRRIVILALIPLTAAGISILVWNKLHNKGQSESEDKKADKAAQAGLEIFKELVNSPEDCFLLHHPGSSVNKASVNLDDRISIYWIPLDSLRTALNTKAVNRLVPMNRKSYPITIDSNIVAEEEIGLDQISQEWRVKSFSGQEEYDNVTKFRHDNTFISQSVILVLVPGLSLQFLEYPSGNSNKLVYTGTRALKGFPPLQPLDLDSAFVQLRQLSLHFNGNAPN